MRTLRLLTFVLVALALVASGCSKKSGGSDAGDPSKPELGEVFLARLGAVGPNPFTKSVALAPVPNVGTTKAASQGGNDGIRSVRGSASGLFGGSATQQVCDATTLVTFLGDDSDRAQAWVDALNDDATLQWSGGAKLSVDDITTYVGELTSVFVQADTRVTNHGLKQDEALAHQAVLQKGTAVLVDKQGVPRVRCASGSPLIAPTPAAKPKYRGEQWGGFSQTRLLIVVPSVELLDTIRIVDIHTGKIIEIPTGSGCCDGTLQTTTTSTTLLDEDGVTTTTKKPLTPTTIRRSTTTGVTTTTPPNTTTPTTAAPATTTPTTSVLR